MSTRGKPYRHLTPEQIALMQRLLRDRPELTNEQIGRLVGCSDSTVGAERRGVRAPREAAKKAAFEAAKAELEKAKAPAQTIPSAAQWAGLAGNNQQATQANQQAAAQAANANAQAALPGAQAIQPQVATKPVQDAVPSVYRLEDEANTLAAQIRVEALKKLRQKLTEGQMSPDDVLAALEQK